MMNVEEGSKIIVDEWRGTGLMEVTALSDSYYLHEYKKWYVETLYPPDETGHWEHVAEWDTERNLWVSCEL